MRIRSVPWHVLVRCVLVAQAVLTRVGIGIAQDRAESAAAPDSVTVLGGFGRILAEHFGPIGLVISAILLVWLLYKIRQYERARDSR